MQTWRVAPLNGWSRCSLPPRDGAIHAAGQHWMVQDPEHARALQRIDAVNGQLLDIGAPLARAISHATLAPRDSSARRNAVKATALLRAGGGVLLAEQEPAWRAMPAAVHTGIGQRRTLTLADSSVLTLNAESAVNLIFSEADRHVQLVRGEIMVTTATNAGARPFRVSTLHGEVHPFCARFTVERMAHESRGAVYRGTIDVAPRAGPTRRLMAGQQTSVDGGTVSAPQVASDDNTAGSEGMEVASGRPLRDFLAELARYRHGHLGCDDAVAALRVSGTYPLADMDRIFPALAHALSLEVVYLTRYWVTLRVARTKKTESW